MIYMVEMAFDNAARQAEWDTWYVAHIRKLLTVLERLVAAGNTVLVIEHNLDVVKTADWIIDLGPEGGDAGGTVVVAGPPEDVAGHHA